MQFKLLILHVLLASQSFAYELYVSPAGSDTNPGTIERPFATIEKARDMISALKKNEDITVYLRAGQYRITKPIISSLKDSAPIDLSQC